VYKITNLSSKEQFCVVNYYDFNIGVNLFIINLKVRTSSRAHFCFSRPLLQGKPRATDRPHIRGDVPAAAVDILSLFTRGR